MVFFLGAGASIAAPSFMPQPQSIQEAVYDRVAPPQGQHRDLIVKSLPEIYHEVLLDLGGDTTRDIWRVLRLWESPAEAPSLAGYELGPNVVHYLVVYLAWKTGVPVVTVNFDQMLERAATRLGLQANVGLDAVTGSESVAIWKLHGTVDDPPSIRTTLQGITATDPDALAKVEREFDRGAACLIGYSGHDIDFFPFLCGWSLPARAYWLDPKPEGTTICRCPDPFLAVKARGEEWARSVIEGLPEADPLAAMLKQELVRPLPPAEAVWETYDDLLRDQAERTYESAFPPGSPKRVLAQAMILAALGRNRDADQWADRYLASPRPRSPALDCRAYMLKSSMAHEFARYEDSRRHAETALALAREEKLRPVADRATLQIDEAKRMLHVPPRLPFAKTWHMLRPESLRTIFQMLFHAARLWPRRRLSTPTGTPPPYAELRATFEYLEHLVRVGAIVQSGAERFLPKAASRPIRDRYWGWIESRSYAAGYAFGISNSKKYRLRGQSSAAESRDPFPVLDLYRMAPSPTGTCIHHRDVAEELAAKLQTTPPGPAHEALEKEAIKHFDEAIDAALEADDPSLELKVMLGLKEIAPSRTWPRSSVEKLLSDIQSPAFARYGEQVVKALAP